MQRKMIVSAVAALLIGGAAMVGAADKPKGPTTRPATTQAAAAKPVNKFCVVESDNKIDPKVFVIYKGKTIGFCCNDCKEDFEKDPEKYIKGLK
jgi:YHS domain-containing protein